MLLVADDKTGSLIIGHISAPTTFGPSHSKMNCTEPEEASFVEKSSDAGHCLA